LRFRLVVDDSSWPLLTGGRCSQVVVKSGLTVYGSKFISVGITGFIRSEKIKPKHEIEAKIEM
jgi:hypothetical protein